MSQDIKFKAGEFQKFRPIGPIRLDPSGKGTSTDDNIVFADTDEVEFDGRILRLNGEEIHLGNPRTLQNAIKRGWFVDPNDDTTTYRPLPANLSVRPADMGSMTEREAEAASRPMVQTSIQEEAQVVSTRGQFREATQMAAQESAYGRAQVRGGVSMSDAHAEPAPSRRPAPPPEPEVFEDEGFEDEEYNAAPPDDDSIFQAKMEVAKALCPGFEWDKTQHWQTRVKTAVDRGQTDPMFLKAVMAVEDETVKKHILKRVLGS